MIPCASFLVPIVAVCVFSRALPAAETVRTLPLDLAATLNTAATLAPGAALEHLVAYAGPAHGMLHLALAQTRWRLVQESTDATVQSTMVRQAESDFRAALQLDPSLRQAHLGLAQLAAHSHDWPTASREAAAGIELTTADAAQLGFLAAMGLRAGDYRLASVAAQQGIIRFPDDAALRRIELATLVHAGRAEDARQAVLALLATIPDDLELWQHLAWAAQETNRPEESLAAREAAMLLNPTDRTLRQQLAEAQHGLHQPQAALLTIAPLIGEPPTPAALADERLMLVASRAAAEGGELTLARRWLAAIPDHTMTRMLRIQSARLAVQAGDPTTANNALDVLITSGEQDPQILTWAASLADSLHDESRAEMLYLRARTSPAILRLVALYLRQNRRAEAATLLATHLATHPDDHEATALQQRIVAKSQP